MNVWKTLKRVNFKSFIQLVGLTLQYVYFLYPTYLATKECMRLSTKHFGREHYRNTPANAFRHALWNYLIAHHCAKRSTNQAKVLKWTKAITDWHENAFINRKLARLMDFHNNEIGRTLYLTHYSKNIESVIKILLNKTNTAIQIKNPEAIATACNQLVYLYPAN